MKKVAVILANGFEEVEAVAPIDILRRAEFKVDIYGLTEEVTGAHNIIIKADHILEEPLKGYNLIMLPGGMPGAKNLRDNELVIKSLQQANQDQQQIAAICAAPIVLEKANLLDGKKFTHFPGFEDQLISGFDQKEAVVVVDGNIVTARGAGVALEFGYTLVDLLGGDGEAIRQDMQYSYLFN